ncbi:hypothetical protein [Streptomyces sp. SYSU K217416]
MAYQQAAPAPATPPVLPLITRRDDPWQRSPTPPRNAAPSSARALTAVGLTWSDNGRQDDLQYLTYTVTDPHGRTWRISPATNFQISPSSPGQIWEAAAEH